MAPGGADPGLAYPWMGLRRQERSQHLARLYPDVVAGRLKPTPRDLLLAAIDKALDPYYEATF